MIKYSEIEKLFNVDSDFKSKLIDEFFDPDDFKKMQDLVMEDYSKPDVPYDKGLGRYSAPNNLSSIRAIWVAEEKVSQLLGEEYKISGQYSVKYQIKDGNIPMLYDHRDTQGGNITVDIVIDSTLDWEIGIEDTLYKESKIGSAIVFNGQALRHWRPEYPSKNESDYIVLMFLVFAKPDHWIFTHGKEFEKVFSKVQQINAMGDEESSEKEELKKSTEALYDALMLIKTANEEVGCSRQREILGIDK